MAAPFLTSGTVSRRWRRPQRVVDHHRPSRAPAPARAEL